MADGLTERLRAAFRWQDGDGADPSGWWRDPALLDEIVDALATLHEEQPTVVVGVATRGFLLGGLVAQRLGVGFVEIRKDRKGDGDHGDAVLRRRTPPDYAQRGLILALRRHALRPRDRVLMVDDWIDTGAQAHAVERLVGDAEASFIGASVIVDATTAAVRRDLNVRSLIFLRQLPD